jgi:CRP/FNR family cyclic AMP-dependent transcriptional regulator
MADYKSLKANEILFHQGDPADNMYIVKSGQIAIFLTDGNVNRVVSHVGVGELLGEVSLFDQGERSAGAKAVCDSSLVILPYENLKRQLETLPEWVRITMKTLSDKMRDTNKKIIE